MKEYIPIEEIGLFIGLPKVFSKRFTPILERKENQRVLDISWLSTADVWRQITAIDKQKENAKHQFPYCFFKCTQISTGSALGDRNFPAKNLYRMGMPGKPNSSGVYLVHRFIPADFQIEVTFITDSYTELKKYINKWNFVSAKQSLNSNWIYDGISITVRVDMETGVAIPDEEAAVEAVNFYEVKTSMTVRGFMSECCQEFTPETQCELNTLVIRPVMYDQQFESLAYQVASDQAGNTVPNYIQRDTIPPSVEEIIIIINQDDDTITFEET